MMPREDRTWPLATFDATIDETCATVAVTGELDLATRDDLAAALRAAQAAGALDVRVDLREVDFVDAGSIGVLLAARRELEARGGSLRIRAASPPVLRVLEVLDLITLFGPLGDRSDAAPA